MTQATTHPRLYGGDGMKQIPAAVELHPFSPAAVSGEISACVRTSVILA